MKATLYVPEKDRDFVDSFKKLAEMNRVSFSTLVLQAMREYTYPRFEKVVVQRQFVPEFLEYLKHYGIALNAEGKFPAPNYKLDWSGTLIAGYHISDTLTEFVCVTETRKKEFEGLADNFLRALDEVIREEEKNGDVSEG